MASPDFGLQMCPTRIDGHRVLFAHKLTQAQCQDRQRGQYHKCWTCVHNNALASKNGQARPKLAAAAGAQAVNGTAKQAASVG